MSDIFISYAREDRGKAKLLADALEKQGWSVWWDRKIVPGKAFDRVIEEAISSAKAIIVLWSKSSVASDWVRSEAEDGRSRGILIPALLDDSKIPIAFRGIQSVNLSTWRGNTQDESYIDLLGALSALVAYENINNTQEIKRGVHQSYTNSGGVISRSKISTNIRGAIPLLSTLSILVITGAILLYFQPWAGGPTSRMPNPGPTTVPPATQVVASSAPTRTSISAACSETSRQVKLAGRDTTFVLGTRLSPNRLPNRTQTVGIIVHSTRGAGASLEADYESAIVWVLNPSVMTSAHVFVGPSQACQMVADGDIAFHAGVHNQTHLGIDFVQPRNDNTFTEFQYRAAAAIVREWCDKYGIPMEHVDSQTRPGIIGHDETDQGKQTGKTDPGDLFQWDYFMRLVRS